MEIDTGYWLLATGYWLLAIDYLPPKQNMFLFDTRLVEMTALSAV
jgi:hypothetical protein